MPIVTLVIGPNSSIPQEDLKIFCDEIVPAALRDPELDTPLVTGDIQLVTITIDDEDAMTVGHLFKIEAEPTTLRQETRPEIMQNLSHAFIECFSEAQSAVFAVYLTLDGYISTDPVENPAVEDMSIEAAIERVMARISVLNEV